MGVSSTNTSPPGPVAWMVTGSLKTEAGTAPLPSTAIAPLLSTRPMVIWANPSAKAWISVLSRSKFSNASMGCRNKLPPTAEMTLVPLNSGSVALMVISPETAVSDPAGSRKTPSVVPPVPTPPFSEPVISIEPGLAETAPSMRTPWLSVNPGPAVPVIERRPPLRRLMLALVRTNTPLLVLEPPPVPVMVIFPLLEVRVELMATPSLVVPPLAGPWPLMTISPEAVTGADMATPIFPSPPFPANPSKATLAFWDSIELPTLRKMPRLNPTPVPSPPIPLMLTSPKLLLTIVPVPWMRTPSLSRRPTFRPRPFISMSPAPVERTSAGDPFNITPRFKPLAAVPPVPSMMISPSVVASS